MNIHLGNGHSNGTWISDPTLHLGYVSVADTLIEAPATIVWTHVINTRSWIYDFHFEHVSGDPMGEGRVEYFWYAGAEGVTGPVTVPVVDRTPETASILKTLAAIPGKLWYGINPPRLKDGMCTSGVNIVVLRDEGEKVSVTAIRSKEVMCSTAEAYRAAQQTLGKQQSVAQLRWTTKYLPRLKELCET